MNRRTSYLPIVFIFAEAAIVSVILDTGLIRAVLTLPLVLFFPGYALTTVLFPKQRLERVERFLFSIGISLAITIVGGLVLQLTAPGLQTISWLALLGGFTMVTSLIGLLRQQPRPLTALESVGVQFSLRQTILLALAVFIVFGAIAVARIGVFQQPTSPYTQLWILPTDKTDRENVQIGVHNMEGSAKQYKLQIQISGHVTNGWTNITLEPNQTWEFSMTLPVNASDADTVEALLFLESDPQVVYRRVSLWTGTAASP